MRRPVAQFALAGLIVLTVFGAAGVLALRSLAHDEALRDARQFALLAGQGIVEPAIRPELLDGDAAAIEAVDRPVNERVLGERVVRVKLWDAGGRIVYSDEPRLIGSTFPLDASKRDVLRTGATRAELSDLSGPENRFEHGYGDLYEVYLPVRASDGTPLLFETYQRRSAVAATGRRIWLPFAALLLASLVLLWLVQVPLAWRLGRRLRRTQEEREALLVRAVEASADERRRIAADLHDGPVQDLAGISYSLSAAAEAEGAPATRRTLREAAATTRDAMRKLRTLLVEIHPPNLQASGLEAAVADLLAPLRAHGIQTELELEPVPGGLDGRGRAARLSRDGRGSAERRAPRERVTRRGDPPRNGERAASRGRRRRGRVLRRGARAAAGRGARRPLAARGARGPRERRCRGTLGTRRRHDVRAGAAAPMIRLVIADDHAVVRTGLRQLASTFEDVELVGAAADGEEAVRICREQRPDVVLMDLEMPVLDGIEATRRIADEQPEVAVVVLTSFSDREQILRALDAGAVGYLLKDAEPEELAKAVRAAARGEAPLDPRAGRALLSARVAASPLDALSVREREVLALVARGLPNKLIARELEISEKTVKAHLTSVFRSIGVSDRTQAALWAERNGLGGS